MAAIIKRVWYSRGPTGHKVKKVSYGYTLQLNGKQERKFHARWTRERAQDALAARLLEREARGIPAVLTLSAAVDRYLNAKSRKKSIADDARHFAMFTAAFGKDRPLLEITAARISAWKAERLAAECPRTKAPYSAAAINRPLTALRHLLRLAREEWEVLPAVPRIRFEKEPEGRLRWLEPDEERRLLEACRRSRTKHLADVVAIALETGLRKAELLDLTWDRVDLSRGVIRFEITKSGGAARYPCVRRYTTSWQADTGHERGACGRPVRIRTAFE